MSKSRDIADSAATINYIDNVTSDVQSQINTLDNALDNISVTSGTLTKTFTTGESSTIDLTSSVLAPVVSVTKEVPQSGVTNNSWDVNSTTENYTRLDSAYDTTLDWAGYGIAQASFVDSFSVVSEDINPFGFCFSANGSKMFVVGTSGDAVYEYALSTSFDVSTASFVDSFSVAAQEITPQGIAFNTDGTKMFVVGVIGDDVNEYILSTGFDVSTASYSQNFSLAGQEATSRDIKFNTDGTKMFVVGEAGDDINEYTLSTGFDVSTASFTTNFSVASEDTTPRGLAFNSNGTKMFVSGAVNNEIFQYSLSTAFDISTASYDSISFDNSSQTSQVNALAFNTDGTKMFFVSSVGDAVYEYTLPLSLALGTGSFASADVGKTIEANSGEFVLTATDGSYVETTAPTSYDQVASGSWEMYGVVYNAADGDLELSGVFDPSTSFDLSTAIYTQTFSVSAEGLNPKGLQFNNDGSKLFVVSESGQEVNEYALSTAYDISSASFTTNFSVSSQTTLPAGLAFKTDGTRMYVSGRNSNSLSEYSLSTAFDISSASYVQTFNIAAQDNQPQSIQFNPDGTRLTVLGSQSDVLFYYTLSTAWNISTCSYTYDYFSVATQASEPLGFCFSSNGTKIFVVDNGTNSVYEYNLSVAYDITTASYNSVSFSVASQDTVPAGIAFNSTGSKMLVAGVVGDDVNEYSIGSLATPTGYQPVHTTASIDSTEWVDINSMTADQAAGDGNVYYAISTDDRTTWTVIDNTDGERDIVRNNAGTWQYNSNSTYASETWTNGTTNTELATLAEAMEGASTPLAYNIAGASYDSVSFTMPYPPIGSPRGIRFNTDGTKMFVCGEISDAVNEFALSTAFDLTTASYVDNFSVASEDGNPQGVEFNANGTKMFVCGEVGDEIHEYSLSTGFDVSSASFTQSLTLNSASLNPQGLTFNTDGTKMFVCGNGANDNITQYTLSTGFDISTASYDSVELIIPADRPSDIVFNPDGDEMIVLTGGGSTVYKYLLSTAFTLSTASLDTSVSVNAEQGSGARGMTVNSDGTKMYIVGISNSLRVDQYSIGGTDYTNQMDKTQLDAVTDPNHIALGDDLDLAIVFNMTSGSTVPSSDGVAINYDATVLNKGAVLGTDYDFDAPAQDKVRITALAGNNLKVRVV